MEHTDHWGAAIHASGVAQNTQLFQGDRNIVPISASMRLFLPGKESIRKDTTNHMGRTSRDRKDESRQKRYVYIVNAFLRVINLQMYVLNIAGKSRGK